MSPAKETCGGAWARANAGERGAPPRTCGDDRTPLARPARRRRGPTRAHTGARDLCRRLLAPLAAPPLLTFLLTATACGAEAKTPEAAAKAFIEAAQRGNTEQLLPLLESAAANRLQTAAERASHHVGGRRTISAHEMLQVADVDPMLRIARVEVISSSESAAQVRLYGSQEQTAELSLVFEDDAWRVQIPTPPPTPPVHTP